MTDSISSVSGAALPLTVLAATENPALSPILRRPSTAPALSAAELHKAATQFEAILVRQLLEPTLNSLASGSAFSADKNSSSSGSGIYGYMLTDVLAQSISQGGGLGMARVIEQQLSASRSPSETNRQLP